MLKGTITRVLAVKGFGFVRVTGTKQEYFVHAKDLADGERAWPEFREGRQVTFEPDSTPKGLRAREVRFAD